MGKLFTSSIGRKLIMSVSGLFLILFLLFHMSMNLVAVFSTEGYNMICHFLGANWYATALTMVLAGGFLVHILYATMLTMKNRSARGEQGYSVSGSSKGVSFASKNMYVLGVIVLLGLGLHLYNFWYNMQFAELLGRQIGPYDPADGAAYIAGLFSSLSYCLIYLAWLGALWFHLTHGFWSAFQTIGFSNQAWLTRLKCTSNIFSTLIVLGFALVVVVFYLRSIMSSCSSGAF